MMVYIVSNVLYQNVCFKNTILPRAINSLTLDWKGGLVRELEM